MELIKMEAQVRQRKGSRESRKLRRTGWIPAVVYGHKKDSLAIALPEGAFLGALKKGGRLFSLNAAGAEENAFIADVHHDALTDAILHVDFARVDMNEQISLEVPLHLHGTAVGVVHGGLQEELKTSVRVRCLPTAIPSQIVVEVAAVEKDHALYLKDVPLPAGVTLDENPDAMVMRVVEKVEIIEAAPAAEVAAVAAVPAQPEVIGKKKEEEEEAAAGEKKGAEKKGK